MDQAQIAAALHSLPGGLMRLDDMRFIGWGRVLIFTCEYAAEEARIPFRLRFEDCRDVQWKPYAHIPLTQQDGQPPTPLLSIRFGRSEHRSPSQLLTEHFGLSLYSDTLTLEDDFGRRVSMSR